MSLLPSETLYMEPALRVIGHESANAEYILTCQVYHPTFQWQSIDWKAIPLTSDLRWDAILRQSAALDWLIEEGVVEKRDEALPAIDSPDVKLVDKLREWLRRQ